MAVKRAREPELIRMSELSRRSAVPTPTIKYYLREGLLPTSTHKTSPNMAYYDARLVDRLRVIKRLQHECFLPLGQIADVLEPAPSAKVRADLDAQQRRQLGGLAPAIKAGARDARRRRGAEHGRRTRRQVLDTMQITDGDLHQLEAAGLLTVRGARATYAGNDLELLEVIDETRRSGLAELFPMEIVAPYVAKLRELVQFELDLFRRRVLGGARLPAIPLATIAQRATALGERLVVALRQRLVMEELARLNGG